MPKELDILYHEINQGNGADNPCHSPEGSERFHLFIEKYKKSSSVDDENEIFNELAEIYDLGQEQAFKAGFNTAVNLIVKR